MDSDKNGQPLLLVSWISAYISFGAVQEIVSLLSGVVAIGSGLMAIRYYFLKSKNEKNV